MNATINMLKKRFPLYESTHVRLVGGLFIIHHKLLIKQLEKVIIKMQIIVLSLRLIRSMTVIFFAIIITNV